MMKLPKLFRRRPEPQANEPTTDRRAIYFESPKRVVFIGYWSDADMKQIHQSYALYEFTLERAEHRRMIALAAPLGEI